MLTCIETSTVISCAGLILDIVGACLIWHFGLPKNVDRNGNVYMILEQQDASEIAKAKRYDRISLLGLCLLISGFVLQLLGNALSGNASLNNPAENKHEISVNDKNALVPSPKKESQLVLKP
jgi:hypothetical protein